MRRSNRWNVGLAPVLLAPVLLLAAVTTMLLPRSAAADPTGRGHRLHHIDPRAAEVWASEVCAQLGGRQRCKVQDADRDELVVFGSDQAHAAIVRMLAERDPRSRPPRTFHVSLVEASNEGGAGVVGNLAPGARAALDDVLAFLPFERFSVLGSGSVRVDEVGTVRIAGAADEIYDVEVRYARAMVRLDGFEIAVAFSARDSRQRVLLDSSLTMTDGESVVIGHVKASSDGPVLVGILTARP